MLAPPQQNRFYGQRAPSDAVLVELYCEGNEWAATAIHARYEKRVRRLAQLHWPSAMRSRFDPDDIVQEVFDRFFRAIRRGIYSPSEASGLWGFLFVVSLNQIRKVASRHLSRRRDVRQTVGQGGAGHGGESKDPRQTSTAHSRLVVEEILEALSPLMREVVERKLEGYTVQEIAHGLMISRRAVERLLHEVRQRVADLVERSAEAVPQAPIRLSRDTEKSARRLTAGGPEVDARRIRIA